MTSRARLNPEDADYLAKLLGMLGSDHAGEIAVAGRKASAFIRRLGLSWRDIVYCPPASWHELAAACAKYPALLNERERNFLHNISRLRRPPTSKQLRWLENIHARLYEQDRAA